MATPITIAVDWSGARRPKGIWFAAVQNNRLIASHACTTREAAIADVLTFSAPVYVGFDFSFSVPAWFARANDCKTIEDVWILAARNGESWLKPTAPFWNTQCNVPAEQRFRRCEQRFPTAKSIFQLVGNGQVGAGSVRGMPLLRELRAAGFTIWPFDDASARTAFEIYPTALRPRVTPTQTFTSNDERDAVCSAFAMWAHHEQLAELRATSDATTQLEGDVWMPAARAADD